MIVVATVFDVTAQDPHRDNFDLTSLGLNFIFIRVYNVMI